MKTSRTCSFVACNILLLLVSPVLAGCVSVDSIRVPKVTCSQTHSLTPSQNNTRYCVSKSHLQYKPTTPKRIVTKPSRQTSTAYSLMQAVKSTSVRRVPGLNRLGKRKWKYIVLHHSASKTGSAKSFGAYHRNVRKWKNGLGYHFVIGNGSKSKNGQIEVGSRWTRQISGAHAGVNLYNRSGIGICIVGNFDNNLPSFQQMVRVRDLCVKLCRACGISSYNIKGHRDVKKTGCPGRYFPMDQLRAEVRRCLRK